MMLLLLMVEEVGDGRGGHNSFVQGFAKVRWSVWSKALGTLRHLWVQGIFCRWGASVDTLWVHSELCQPGHLS